eukprot:Colp12_sorted_trinity150504_noHs@16552
MVSIQNTGSGGFFFQDESTENECLLTVPDGGFDTRELHAYRRIPTLWAALVEILVIVTLEVLMFLPLDAKGQDPSKLEYDPPYPLLTALHVFVWVVITLLERYKYYHHRVSRLNGFLRFYRQTRNLRKVSFVVLSVGNAVLLVLTMYWTWDESYHGLTRLNVMQIVYSIECALCSLCLVIYAVRVVRFNRSTQPPDAHSELLPSLRAPPL